MPLGLGADGVAEFGRLDVVVGDAGWPVAAAGRRNGGAVCLSGLAARGG